MRIQKKELAQKIKKLKGIIPTHTTISALQGLLVKDGYLIANNLEIACKVKLEGAEGESFLIPAKAIGLINSLEDVDIDIEADGKEAITIQTLTSKSWFATQDAEQFPLPEELGDDAQESTMDGAEFLAALRHVSCAVASEAGNEVMNAMLMESDGDAVNFVGLDGRMVIWDRVYSKGKAFSILIPKPAVEKLQDIGLFGGVCIRHGQNSASFSTNDIEVYTRLVEGEYFGYKRFFAEMPIRSAVYRPQLISVVGCASACVSGQPAVFELSGNSLEVSICDSMATYSETMRLQKEISEYVSFGANLKLMLQALKVFDCDYLDIQLVNEKSPIVFTADGRDMKAVVLPVLIKKAS